LSIKKIMNSPPLAVPSDYLENYLAGKDVDDVVSVSVDRIDMYDRRETNDAAVKAIAESIEKIGLRHPPS
jgi:hypothetical protein